MVTEHLEIKINLIKLQHCNLHKMLPANPETQKPPSTTKHKLITETSHLN